MITEQELRDMQDKRFVVLGFVMGLVMFVFVILLYETFKGGV